MIKRGIELDLTAWKTATARRPMVLRGARQVGKSFLAQWFAKNHFQNFVEVNFEARPDAKSVFEDLNVVKICRELSALFNAPIEPGKTLLFLDEIQECPQALLALRYFFEEMPDLHVIAAGSLLDLLLNDPPEGLRIPVGRIEYRYMQPISFREFLAALGESGLSSALSTISLKAPFSEALHSRALSLLGEYIQVGGMPAVVEMFQQQRATTRYRELQASIHQTYRDDFRKYRGRIDADLLEGCYRRLPFYATKKFKYNELLPDTQSRTTRRVLDLFEMARVITKIHRTAGNGVPLDGEQKVNDYKYTAIDIGILNNSLQLPLITRNDWSSNFVHSGIVAEQFVGQELLSLAPSFVEPRLYYWQREQHNSNAQVDFLVGFSGRVIPIEVKAGSTGALKSLRMFMENKGSEIGVRISQHELSFHDRILSVPLYAVSELERLVGECMKDISIS